MTDAVKPITEAELRHLLLRLPEDIAADFRMRGFMAKEPERSPEVDEIADAHGINLSAMPRVERALEAALKRGMEMRPPLTREISEIRDRWQAEYDDYASYGGGRLAAEAELANKISAANEIIAALTKEQS